VTLRAGEPLVTSFEGKVVRVVEVSRGTERVLSVAGRAVAGKPIRVDVLVARTAVLVEPEKRALPGKRGEARKRERFRDLLQVTGLAQ
jgi:hypothetical protein